MQFFVAAGVIAVQFVAGRAGPAIGIDLVHVHFGIQVAEVLPGGEDIVEAMFELIAERLLVTLVLVDARLTFEEMIRDALAVTLVQGTVGRQSTMVATIRIMLQVGLQGQRSVFAEIDAEGRGQREAFFLVVVELGVRLVRQAGEAVGNALVVVQRAAEVETHTLLPLGTNRGLYLVIGLIQGFLAGQCYQATR
ncbi:hypothetical protein D3C76_502200 [compost metagenome]